MLFLGERGNVQTAQKTCQAQEKGLNRQAAGGAHRNCPPALGRASLEQINPAGELLSSPQGAGCRKEPAVPTAHLEQDGASPALPSGVTGSRCPVTCRDFTRKDSHGSAAPAWGDKPGTIPDGDASSREAPQSSEQQGLEESPGLLGKQRHAWVILSGRQLHILWLSALPEAAWCRCPGA